MFLFFTVYEEYPPLSMFLGGRFILQVLGTAGVALVTAPQELLDLPTPPSTSERSHMMEVSERQSSIWPQSRNSTGPYHVLD